LSTLEITGDFIRLDALTQTENKAKVREGKSNKQQRSIYFADNMAPKHKFGKPIGAQ